MTQHLFCQAFCKIVSFLVVWFFCFLSNNFLLFFDSFQNHTGNYDNGHIWILANKDDLSAHLWHNYYSVHTNILWLLACHVCSKVLGIGCAEQSWKKVKKNMIKDLIRLSTVTAKMQATIAGIHLAEINKEDHSKQMPRCCLGWWQLWDTWFGCALSFPWCCPRWWDQTKNCPRFWTCLKDWEDVNTKPHGDIVLEQRILRKYGGLQFVDPFHCKEFIVHQDQASIEKEKWKNWYELFCILDGFVTWLMTKISLICMSSGVAAW